MSSPIQVPLQIHFREISCMVNASLQSNINIAMVYSLKELSQLGIPLGRAHPYPTQSLYTPRYVSGYSG